MMKVVGIVLPQGLGGDVKNTDWTQKHLEPDHHPPADEELLLEKIGKTPPLETCDSSGCGASNESVDTTPCAPYVMTGDVSTIQNSTYVPFSVSTTTKESIEKNTAGYVVAGNFQESCDSSDCISGHESVTPCAPYVLTGDVPKVPNTGYVPYAVSTTESAEKNTGYVVAGSKNMFIPDLLPRRKTIKED